MESYKNVNCLEKNASSVNKSKQDPTWITLLF